MVQIYVTSGRALGGVASPHLPFRSRRQTHVARARVRTRRGQTSGIAAGRASRVSSQALRTRPRSQPMSEAWFRLRLASLVDPQ